ncbi:MAG: hypothetical protein JWO05_2000 [Gemmatimonadetes bacterium]|nr:hypothetical protein [Gemmatimonadota bacterium]
MSTPDVSIVIPAFNRLWSLPETIDSCRGTECSVEIIVVDDGSTDGTFDWLQAQPGVVAFRQHNMGKDWAVARGMQAARGRYVKYVDSDDWVLPGAIDAHVRAADEAGADLVLAGYEFADSKGTVLRAYEYQESDDLIAQMLGESDSSHYSAFLFRRSLVQDIPHRQEFDALDDRMFVLEVALANPDTIVLPAPAIRLRHHENARLQFNHGIKAAVRHHAHAQVYRRILARLAAEGRLTPRRRRAAALVLWPVAHWLAYADIDEGCRLVDWIRELDPQFEPPPEGALGAFYRRLGFRRTEQLLRLRRRAIAAVRSLQPRAAAHA